MQGKQQRRWVLDLTSKHTYFSSSWVLTEVSKSKNMRFSWAVNEFCVNYLPIVLSTWKPKPLSDLAALCISASFLPNTDCRLMIHIIGWKIRHRKMGKQEVKNLTWLLLDAPNSINSVIMYEPPVGSDPTLFMTKLYLRLVMSKGQVLNLEPRIGIQQSGDHLIWFRYTDCLCFIHGI